MLCYAMPCFAMLGVDQCNQVRALTAGLMSTAVSSAVTVLGRHAFKAATKFGEGGRAIKMHKFQRNQLLFETFEEEHVAALERATTRKSMPERTSSRPWLMLSLKPSGASAVFRRSKSSRGCRGRTRARRRSSTSPAAPMPRLYVVAGSTLSRASRSRSGGFSDITGPAGP